MSAINFKERYQKSNDKLALTEKKKEGVIRRLAEAEREGHCGTGGIRKEKDGDCFKFCVNRKN